MAREPRDFKPRDQAPINVAVIDVRGCRCAGGENFSGVNQGAGVRRRKANRHERGIRQHAVRHAERAVDKLRSESDGEKKPPVVHETSSPVRTTLSASDRTSRPRTGTAAARSEQFVAGKVAGYRQSVRLLTFSRRFRSKLARCSGLPSFRHLEPCLTSPQHLGVIRRRSDSVRSCAKT